MKKILYLLLFLSIISIIGRRTDINAAESILSVSHRVTGSQITTTGTHNVSTSVLKSEDQSHFKAEMSRDSNALAYQIATSDIRIYTGTTFTISVDSTNNYTFTKFIISESGQGNYTIKINNVALGGSGGKGSSNKEIDLTGKDATSVSIYADAQVRITRLDVYYISESTEPQAIFKNGSEVFDTSTIMAGKITKPINNPEADNKMFIGWSTTEDATNLFDFESTNNTAETILYAVYRDLTAIEKLENKKTMASMNFNYIPAVNNNVVVTAASKGGSGASESVDTINAEYMGLDSSLFTASYALNGSTTKYIKENDIRLYTKSGNGNSLEFQLLNPNFKITRIRIKITTGGDNTQLSVFTDSNETAAYVAAALTTEYYDTLSKSIEATKIVIKNTNSASSGNNITIHSIQITYSNLTGGGNTPTSVISDSVALRFGTTIEKSLVNQIALENSEATIKYGVEYDVPGIGNKIVEYTPLVSVTSAGDTESDDDGDFYQFAIVIPLPSDKYNVEITARVFVEIDGVKYYMEDKAYSFVTMAEAYFDIIEDEELLEVLMYIVTELGGNE